MKYGLDPRTPRQRMDRIRTGTDIRISKSFSMGPIPKSRTAGLPRPWSSRRRARRSSARRKWPSSVKSRHDDSLHARRQLAERIIALHMPVRSCSSVRRLCGRARLSVPLQSHVRNVEFQRLEILVASRGGRDRSRTSIPLLRKGIVVRLSRFLSVVGDRIGARSRCHPGPEETGEGIWTSIERIFRAPHDGIYRFHLRCAPRGRILLHDTLVVESEGRHASTSARIALKQGLHPFVFQIYFEWDDDKTLAVSYEGPEITLQPLLPNALCHAVAIQKAFRQWPSGLSFL